MSYKENVYLGHGSELSRNHMCWWSHWLNVQDSCRARCQSGSVHTCASYSSASHTERPGVCTHVLPWFHSEYSHQTALTTPPNVNHLRRYHLLRYIQIKSQPLKPSNQNQATKERKNRRNISNGRHTSVLPRRWRWAAHHSVRLPVRQERFSFLCLFFNDRKVHLLLCKVLHMQRTHSRGRKGPCPEAVKSLIRIKMP